MSDVRIVVWMKDKDDFIDTKVYKVSTDEVSKTIQGIINKFTIHKSRGKYISYEIQIQGK